MPAARVTEGMSSGIKVAIIDDHPVMLSGLVAVLTAPPQPFVIVGKVEAVEDFEALTGLPAPDVVLLDLDLPRGLRGADAVRHLSSKYPVVVYTSEKDHRRLLQAREAGASACLPKIVDTETVRSVLRLVAGGEHAYTALDVDAARQTIKDFPAIELTLAQEVVLEMMSDGLDNAAILARLGITRKTLESHISSVFQQLRSVGILEEQARKGDRATAVAANRREDFAIKRRDGGAGRR